MLDNSKLFFILTDFDISFDPNWPESITNSVALNQR